MIMNERETMMRSVRWIFVIVHCNNENWSPFFRFNDFSEPWKKGRREREREVMILNENKEVG